MVSPWAIYFTPRPPPTKSYKSTPRAYPSLTYNFRARCCPGLFGIPSVFHRLLFFCKLADLSVSASAAKNVKWMIPTGSSSFVIRQRVRRICACVVVAYTSSCIILAVSFETKVHPPPYADKQGDPRLAFSVITTPRLAFPAVTARVCPRPSSLKSRACCDNSLRTHLGTNSSSARSYQNQPRAV